MIKNILSIDVEEIFHAEYARNSKNRNFTYRTLYNIPPILDVLKEQNVAATFFMVGELAEKFTDIVRMIKKQGHEVAFHSYDHKPLWEKDPEQLEIEIERFNNLLASITGHKCLGFRAPSFSLDNTTKWAFGVLDKMGILYDSSVFPSWTPLYGVSGAPIKPYEPLKDDLASADNGGKLWEFPLTVYSFLGFRIPAAGGFYLRFMPSLLRKAIKKMNKLGAPAVIFVHNWELDSDTPKLKLNPYKSFVTYHNIGKTLKLVKGLLHDFEFTSFAEYMETSGMI
ncbi:MAG TPA: polysaccharide deacetylase family protein [Candidatus Bathyarchaeia archaeon]|nr:polysaccharide deacetylase family protein [Candidatus Bathyarchaeia archaeon]